MGHWPHFIRSINRSDLFIICTFITSSKRQVDSHDPIVVISSFRTQLTYDDDDDAIWIRVQCQSYNPHRSIWAVVYIVYGSHAHLGKHCQGHWTRPSLTLICKNRLCVSAITKRVFDSILITIGRQLKYVNTGRVSERQTRHVSMTLAICQNCVTDFYYYLWL